MPRGVVIIVIEQQCFTSPHVATYVTLDPHRLNYPEPSKIWSWPTGGFNKSGCEGVSYVEEVNTLHDVLWTIIYPESFRLQFICECCQNLCIHNIG